MAGSVVAAEGNTMPGEVVPPPDHATQLMERHAEDARYREQDGYRDVSPGKPGVSNASTEELLRAAKSHEGAAQSHRDAAKYAKHPEDRKLHRDAAATQDARAADLRAEAKAR